MTKQSISPRLRHPTISRNAICRRIPTSFAPAGRARSRIMLWDNGHDRFEKVFEDCGGKIVQKIWPPLGTKDFGPFIPTIKADADAVFALMVGPMALQFPKQLRAAGYKKPIIGGGTSYDEFALPFMGDEVVGDVSSLQYSAALQT